MSDSDDLKEKERLWMENFRPIAKKMKELGWRLPDDDGIEDEILDGDIWQFVVLDPSGKKHWIRVPTKGSVYFAPVVMVCRGEGVI